jgi:hypothetical protein
MRRPPIFLEILREFALEHFHGHRLAAAELVAAQANLTILLQLLGDGLGVCPERSLDRLPIMPEKILPVPPFFR